MVYLQRWHGWCHVKMLPSRRVLCTPYNHAPRHFMQSHIRKVHACFSCNLPPARLAGWPGSFTCYCGNTGVERMPKKDSAQKKIKLSRHSCRDSNPRPIIHESGALTTELFPLHTALYLHATLNGRPPSIHRSGVFTALFGCYMAGAT